jgi:ABC-2 type transport system ATP-binding protein
MLFMGTLVIDQVTKSFHRQRALHNVELQIPPGLFGLLGPNGAGKTTLMRIIATILQPDSGTIQYNGTDWRHNPREVRRILGYLPQHFGAFRNISAIECLDYIGILKGLDEKTERKRQIEAVLADVNLTEHAKKKVGTFSGGMLRRLGIAQALLGNPQIVMVDEPTAGLDPEERIRFRMLLRRCAQNRTVILSTHILEDIQTTCDGLAVLKQGNAYQFSDMQDLAAKARGRVWKLTVKAEDYDKFVSTYKIISTLGTTSGMEIRLLSDQRPSQDAEPVEPTVEEGYLTWINT